MYYEILITKVILLLEMVKTETNFEIKHYVSRIKITFSISR